MNTGASIGVYMWAFPCSPLSTSKFRVQGLDDLKDTVIEQDDPGSSCDLVGFTMGIVDEGKESCHAVV